MASQLAEKFARDPIVEAVKPRKVQKLFDIVANNAANPQVNPSVSRSHPPR